MPRPATFAVLGPLACWLMGCDLLSVAGVCPAPFTFQLGACREYVLSISFPMTKSPRSGPARSRFVNMLLLPFLQGHVHVGPPLASRLRSAARAPAPSCCTAGCATADHAVVCNDCNKLHPAAAAHVGARRLAPLRSMVVEMCYVFTGP
jgi:hypothetical protein